VPARSAEAVGGRRSASSVWPRWDIGAPRLWRLDPLCLDHLDRVICRKNFLDPSAQLPENFLGRLVEKPFGEIESWVISDGYNPLSGCFLRAISDV
jgi:hypothetical protein